MDPEEAKSKAEIYARIAAGQPAGWCALALASMEPFSRWKATTGARVAVKFFADQTFFWREIRAYQRLAERGGTEIMGFRIPALLKLDEHVLAIELSIVTRSFLLDFAASRLDAPPDFPAEVLEHWLAEKAAQFGERWPLACRIVSELEDHGIYLTDISPSNIGFEINS